MPWSCLKEHIRGQGNQITFKTVQQSTE